MDHGGDTSLRGQLNAVGEREEGVGRHHGPARVLSGLFQRALKCGDTAGLTHADADGAVALCEHNRVGLDVPHNFPGKIKLLLFLFRRCAFCDNPRLGLGIQSVVALLDQQAAGDALEVVVKRNVRVAHLFEDEQAQVLLLRQNLERFVGKTRSQHNFDEQGVDGLRGRGVANTVHRNHAAEDRHGVGLIGVVPSLKQCLPDADAAGVCMFDGHNAGLLELTDDFERVVGVIDVVVTEFFTVEHLRRRKRTGKASDFTVKRAGLVRVFAVTQGLLAFIGQRHRLGIIGPDFVA